MSDSGLSLECLTCERAFQIDFFPEHCPNCGLPRNEQFGKQVAKSNPNITGFDRL